MKSNETVQSAVVVLAHMLMRSGSHMSGVALSNEYSLELSRLNPCSVMGLDGLLSSIPWANPALCSSMRCFMASMGSIWLKLLRLAMVSSVSRGVSFSSAVVSGAAQKLKFFGNRILVSGMLESRKFVYLHQLPLLFNGFRLATVCSLVA